jgi:hypothetical protein
MCLGVRSWGQAIRGLEPTGFIGTSHFEIFYSRGLEKEASRLAGFADSTLARIEAIFGDIPFSGRIPVLLTDIQPELNGYSTSYPSNRIVLYLAEPDLRDALATFDDELKLVFTHELVHAVNLNEKAPFWKLLAAIVGDVCSPVAWTMPYALLEGTAVWVESDNSTGEGRLNDPAALETVRIDLEQGLKRSIWDVSGVLEYPGSGSLPYLYGGLYIEYFAQRYGKEALAEIWRAAGEGNIFGGFDGAPGISGIVENITGRKSGEVWNDFLDWAHGRLGLGSGSPGASNDRLLLRGRFGPIASDGKKIYYLDLVKMGVFALDTGLADGPADAAAPAVRLFDADSYLKGIRLGNKGKSLDLEWIRTEADGTRKPQDYEYDLESGELRPKAGASGQAAPGSVETRLGTHEWEYRLLRIGPRIVPGRVSRGGKMEYLEIPEGSLRSMQPESDSLIALSLAPPGSGSKIAVLREESGKWEILLQKSSPPGGAHLPAFAGGTKIAYTAWLPEGKEELRLMDFSAALDSGLFEATEARWLDLPARQNDPSNAGLAEPKGKTALFPRALASVRYPYIGNESAGLVAMGSDLTERLSWKAIAGWEFDSKIPETGLEIRLDASGHDFQLTISDSSMPSHSGYARVSGASLSWGYTRRMLPVTRAISLGAFVSASGVRDSYTPSLWLQPGWDHSSLGGGISLSYSDLAYDTFAPFNLRGGSVSLAGDYEYLPGIAQAVSLSGSVVLATARPGIKLSAFGTFCPWGSLRFLPSGRYFRVSGVSRGSAIPIRYPYYEEYSALNSGSPWYGFAEIEARILSVETGRIAKPVRLPFMPGFALRRFSILTGLRAAAMEVSMMTILPASGFLRLETDFALLAGFASHSHCLASIEAAYAFDSTLSGGTPLFINLGFGVWY